MFSTLSISNTTSCIIPAGTFYIPDIYKLYLQYVADFKIIVKHLYSKLQLQITV